MDTVPLPGPFGVSVGGLDLSKPLSYGEEERLVGLLHEHLLVLVRGQDLSFDDFLRFGSYFGAPYPHVIRQARREGYPGILTLSNREYEGRVPSNGGAHWHTDQSYDADPATATMLHCADAPKVGGETRYCDLRKAYEDLPDAMKTRIENLNVVHLYGRGFAARDDDLDPAALRSEAQIAAAPAVVHPLVRPHSVTGQKTLYALLGTCRGIIGMDEDVGRELVEELADHALRQSYIYAHKWEVGDVLIWDTQATLHKGPRLEAATGNDDLRRLHRISVKGTPPSCFG